MEEKEQKHIGRPLMYNSVEEMQEKIDQYFVDCEGELFRDDDGEIVYDKFGKPIIMNAKPPTVTGLALALGFTSRQALLNYQNRDEFFDAITRAKTRIEEYVEGRLFDKDGVTGAKFSLANNFKNWTDKAPTELDKREQEARIKQIEAQTEHLTDTGGAGAAIEDFIRAITPQKQDIVALYASDPKAIEQNEENTDN